MSDMAVAVILGVIEALTEFLPVSSTGHMIIAMPWLGVNPDAPPWRAFLYFIQIGAILAVVAAFFGRLWRQVVHVPATGWANHIIPKLVIATLPAAAIGLPLNDWVEAHLEKPVFVAVALILGAFVMEWIERSCRRDRPMQVEDITWRQALIIGVAQCVSIIPGTSRAMATIMGGLLVGLSGPVATEFSFYLAIPTLLGAGLMKLVKYRDDIHQREALLLTVGFAVAFVVALAVVRGFLRYVQARRLRAFAIYRVVLGVAVLAWWWRAAAG